jgi:hypothetical protein
MTMFREQLPRSGSAEAGRWIFAGEVHDNLRFDGHCSFCGETNSRFTFVLSEVAGAGTCGTCQDCLAHGDTRVEHEQRGLEGKERRDYLSGLTVRLALRSCRDVLRQLMACTEDAALKAAAVYFDRNIQLSPAHAATVLEALVDARLGVNSRIFQVRIRSAAHRQEFGDLDSSQQLLVWPLFSAGVQKRLVWLGLAAPEHASTRPRRRRYADPLRPGNPELRAQ